MNKKRGVPDEPSSPARAPSESKPPKADGKKSLRASRRGFLRGIGGLTVASWAAGGVAVTEVLTPEARAIEIAPTAPSTRTEQSKTIRKTAADNEKALGVFTHQTNGDEELYPNRIGNFSKTLPHNQLGEVDPSSYNMLLNALQTGSFTDFENVPQGGTATYLNPLGGLGFNMEGPDSPAVPVFAVPPAFASAGMAAALAELYWEAVCRDVSFANYAADSLIAQAAADLNTFTAFQGPRPVTPQNIFRYDYPGALVGPIVSQFLLRAFRFDGVLLDGKTRVPLPVNGGAGFDFLTEYNEWLDRQRGVAVPANDPHFQQQFDPVARFPRSVRDLGQVAGQDFIYSTYFRAALILGGFGAAALDPGNPYRNSTRQGAFATLGAADLVRLVGSAHKAERHVWFQKWNTHRYLRPEAMGGRIHNHKTGATTYPIHPSILNSPVLNLMFQYNQEINTRRALGGQGSFLLPQLFVGGGPAHPSAPAGHAVSAGACCTILKAWHDENFPIPNPVVPTADGTGLTPFTGPGTLTIGSELNKLTHNMTEGRNMSGVHWRVADNLTGNLIGEEVAIRILREAKPTYPESFTLTLTKFDGTTITI